MSTVASPGTTGEGRAFDAVLFDFAGVFTASPFAGLREWGARAGVDPDTAIAVAFGDYDDDTQHPWQRAERGELALAEAVALIGRDAERIGLTVDPAGLQSFFRPSTLQQDMLGLARRVRRAGYRSGLLTNTIDELRPYWWPLLPVEDLFDVVVESAAVGMRKPDPRIFAFALERLGAGAARTVFIDDWPGHVAAAERLGMTGVVVDEDRDAVRLVLDDLLGLERCAV